MNIEILQTERKDYNKKMIDFYTDQLKIVLQQYQSTIEDIQELHWAKNRITEKSKNNVYKEINIREINNKLIELDGQRI